MNQYRDCSQKTLSRRDCLLSFLVSDRRAKRGFGGHATRTPICVPVLCFCSLDLLCDAETRLNLVLERPRRLAFFLSPGSFRSLSLSSFLYASCEKASG